MAKEWSIPGMSIAVIKDGKVAWYKGFGVRNMNSKERVDENTIFDGASLTKPLFAYFTMIMVDKKIIDLDTPIVEYMSKEKIENYLGRFGYSISQPGFRYDWFSKITPRHILSHSAGLCTYEIHLKEKPEVYPIYSEPGTKFKYSPPGYFILQTIFEDILGERLDILMHKYVFEPLKMDNSYMVWNEKIRSNAAFGHNIINVPVESLREAKDPHAGGSLYSTAGDYAKFLAAVLNGKLLTKKSQMDMFTPVIDIEPNLPYAPGFSLDESSKGTCIWHTGDYVIFRNFAMADTKTKTGVVYFTNSFYGLQLYTEVIDMVFEGDHSVASCDFLKYYRSLKATHMIMKDVDKAIEYVSTESFKKSWTFTNIENTINYMKDEFMKVNKIDVVIKLYKYVTTTFPESANGWHNLGEAYMKTGQNELAIEAYEKSLELEPDNEKTKENLIKLKEKKEQQSIGQATVISNHYTPN
jgi:CubicO group peptidase (beta-lactamase class C family)